MTDFRQLKYFAAVVSAGNFSKASDIVHLTQPALTRSIQNLEYEVGVPLLLRQSTGVVPTDAGKLLLERANKILSDWVHTKADINSLKERSEGHLNIGIAPLFAHGIMGHILEDFREQSPTATISITQGPYNQLRGHLLDGNCDVLLTTFPMDQPQDGLELRQLLNIRAGILANSSHPLAKKTKLSQKDFKDASWALYSRAAEDINYYLEQNEIDLPSAVIKTNSLSFLIKLVQQKNYLTSLAPVILIDEIVAGDVVLLQEPRSVTNRHAGLIVAQKREDRPLVEKFSSSALKVCEAYKDRL